MPDDDVKITVTNETPATKCVLIFFQDPDLDQIFFNVFPTAWQVFELAGKKHPYQAGGQAKVILPAAISLAGGRADQAFTGRVATADVANPGEKWALDQTRTGNLELKLQKNTGGGDLLCVNNSGNFASISLLKNSRPVLTFPKVPHKALTVFRPVETLCLAWIEWIVEGSAIRAAIGSPRAVTVPLPGKKAIDATLEQDLRTGEIRWRITATA